MMDEGRPQTTDHSSPLVPTQHSALTMHLTQRALTVASCLYLFNASTGARVAIDEDIPTMFLGRCSPNMPQEDFVRGMGTALSPGVKMLAAQVALTLLVGKRGPLRKVGALGLALYGAAATVGMLGERITYVALHPKTFDPPRAIIILGNIFLPVTMLVLGLVEFNKK
jgi:hypothetical protein